MQAGLSVKVPKLDKVVVGNSANSSEVMPMDNDSKSALKKPKPASNLGEDLSMLLKNAFKNTDVDEGHRDPVDTSEHQDLVDTAEHREDTNGNLKNEHKCRMRMDMTQD